MIKCLVTGGAGFIGSHLIERLLEEGYKVIGIDCLTDYYSIEIKRNNLKDFLENRNFKSIEGNLLDLNLEKILMDADYIFHQAAQAGVRASWGQNFGVYEENNVLGTQKLLEACKNLNIKKFVYASSSSVYGDVKSLPMKESDLLKPLSPYGVSKLAGEHLCYLYWKNFDVPTISLRYFSVYGPRQRPDMAFYKFINAILNDKEITIYGDGNQTRDFTFISDVIDANILAMKSNIIGEVFNIGGGSRISVNEVIKILEGIIGKEAKVEYIEKQKGDVEHTYSSIEEAKNMLGYNPKIDIRTGLERMVEYYKVNQKLKGENQ